ncbi:hypothetical protein p1B104 (plasmid) [Aromatoleum aromaticum EbN1]|uniref:Uncharacterized protein n=1 Tax=Aromatoleum aromaticum (strain DSM 19018 / LMG 30748 / EbN1) TaxID=76114 RepID=Q5NX93_AROAE|nr:hypothetical protein p1B104 [Aromatoleum aromaticum EbN1]
MLVTGFFVALRVSRCTAIKTICGSFAGRALFCVGVFLLRPRSLCLGLFNNPLFSLYLSKYLSFVHSFVDHADKEFCSVRKDVPLVLAWSKLTYGWVFTYLLNSKTHPIPKILLNQEVVGFQNLGQDINIDRTYSKPFRKKALGFIRHALNRPCS